MSEIRVEGGRPFDRILPSPPATAGPFQGLPVTDALSVVKGIARPRPEYYADVAVIAFSVPDDDVTLVELQPKVSSSGGTFSLAELTDGDVAATTLLPASPVGTNAWVQFEFVSPRLSNPLRLRVAAAVVGC